MPTYQAAFSELLLWSGSWIVAVKITLSPRRSDWEGPVICTVGGILMGPLSTRQFVEPPARRVSMRSLVLRLATAQRYHTLDACNEQANTFVRQ